MMRKIEALGLVLLASLAVGAMTAAGASAANFQSESEKTTLTAKATETHKIDAGGLELRCNEANFTANTTSPTSETITLSGGYKGCTFISTSVNVFMNGCGYLLYSHKLVDIVCKGANEEIEFSGPGCTIQIPAQTGLQTITYDNVGSGATREFAFTPKLTGIKYTESGFLCGFTTTTNGSYTSGATQVTGEVTGSNTHTGVGWGPLPTLHSESPVTSLTVAAGGSHVIDVAGLSISCSKAAFSGTTAATTVSAITLSVSYSECTFLGISVTLNMNGCDYEFDADSTMSISCPVGSSIEWSMPGCTIKIPTQSAGTVTYDNVGTGATRELKVTPSLTKLKYTEAGSLCGSGTTTNGSITTGPTTITGENAGSHVGIWATT